MTKLNSTPEAPVQRPQQTSNASQGFTPHFAGVPIDVYNFFDMVPGSAQGKQLEAMKQISEWAFNGADSIGDGLMRLKEVSMKLGEGRFGDNRLNRVSNYIKLDNSINDLRMRQEAV